MSRTIGHIPNYNVDDLANKALLKKRAWRIEDGAFLCGHKIGGNRIDAGTRAYASCKNCIKKYDRWFEQMRTSDDLLDRVKISHLSGTNMDPANGREVK